MIIGTTLKITATLSAIADSVKIDIYKPDSKIDISAANMTDEGGNVWTYVYQSALENGSGQHKAIIKAVSGSYMSVGKILFELEEQ